jgi:hypothetical protein
VDIPLFLTLLVVVSLICIVFVVLFTSALANRSIKDTLLDLWHTYFGKARRE